LFPKKDKRKPEASIKSPYEDVRICQVNYTERGNSTSRSKIKSASNFRTISAKSEDMQSTLHKTIVLSRLSSGRNKEFYLRTMNSDGTFKVMSKETTDTIPPIPPVESDIKLRYIKKEKNKFDVSNAFIFNDYHLKYDKDKKIKDKRVDKMLKDLKYSPYSTSCFSCNYKNLEFYDIMRPESAITILNQGIKHNYNKGFKK
jgi:hypothetical protein